MEVSVINRRLRLITLTETLIILHITKTESNNCFTTHCFQENNEKTHLSHRTQFIFEKRSSYFAVRDLDIALGNHALRAQPLAYSLVCKQIIE